MPTSIFWDAVGEGSAAQVFLEKAYRGKFKFCRRLFLLYINMLFSQVTFPFYECFLYVDKGPLFMYLIIFSFMTCLNFLFSTMNYPRMSVWRLWFFEDKFWKYVNNTRKKNGSVAIVPHCLGWLHDNASWRITLLLTNINTSLVLNIITRGSCISTERRINVYWKVN